MRRGIRFVPGSLHVDLPVVAKRHPPGCLFSLDQTILFQGPPPTPCAPPSPRRNLSPWRIQNTPPHLDSPKFRTKPLILRCGFPFSGWAYLCSER